MKQLTFLLIAALWWAQASAQGSAFGAGKNIDLYFSALRGLDLFYVDTLDYDRMVEGALDDMLRTLDPYTTRISEDAASDFDFSTTGEYGGVGMLIRQRAGRVEAAEIYEHSPAHRAGVQVGDQIIQIDTIILRGKNIGQVSQSLKGKIGTSVQVKLLRYPHRDTALLNVVRAKIHIPAVPYYGLLGGSRIGYIAFTSFTANCSNEVKNALLRLREQGAEGIVLDLRGNTGGLMDEAVNVVELFVPKGQSVVSMRGRTGKENVLRTKRAPVAAGIPLAVLINGMSASSSEIVAGALQDLDRAIIVGQKSYGKGLVQNVIPLPFNQRIKITTARYYTPSGRCVQAINYTRSGKRVDTTHNRFRTAAGRPVYDAGGIAPDVALPQAKYSALLQALLEKEVIHDFASSFRAVHPDDPSGDDFVLSASDYDSFIDYARTEKFTYNSVAEQRFTEFEKAVLAKRDTLFPAHLIAEIKDALQRQKDGELLAQRDEIIPYIEQEIASRYYFQWGRVRIGLHSDDEVAAAAKILADKEMYAAQLQPRKE